MASNAHAFPHTSDQLKAIAEEALNHAKKLGASNASIEISEGDGLSVTVRCGDIETIEHHRAKAMNITLYVGHRRGDASTSDLSAQAIRETAAAAYDIARLTAEDPCAGLADTALLETMPPALDLYHPWQIDPHEAAAIAKRAENAAFDVDAKITNSEGASVSTQHSQFVLATSHGFMGGYATSRHDISCSCIAGDGATMQRDDWYTSERLSQALEAPEAVGQHAAKRTLARLGARRLTTRQCPVLFEAPLAAGLLGTFMQAASGGALYRKMTFLIDCLGQPLFAPHIQITEDPHIPRAMGSAPFDAEGVRTQRREIVSDGVLEGYFLSSYSGRKLGMPTTGSAGGSHNLHLHSTLTQPDDDFRAMLKKLDTGLLLTELMGQGVNYVTGDYSRGAAGFWVERGEIQYPVEEITIASTLQTMFQNILAVGTDTFTRGTKKTGSVLIREMMVAGE